MAANIPEWRFGGGWTEHELSLRLAALVAATESAERSSTVGARKHGGRLRHVASAGLLAREGPGAPERGGAFARARELLVAYELSDPAIVTAHFDRRAPLSGRHMLLEIKVLGLRYLCAVVVSEVLEGSDDSETRFGFRLDTLAPHLERGSEWFTLTKNHRDGAVRFSITARWEPGQFPNRWSRLGFGLLARRYQRAWHRRAFRRLRDRLVPDSVGVIASYPVTSPAWAAPARLAAVAGLRPMTALALVSRALENAGSAGHGRAGRILASPAAGLILPVFAALDLLVGERPVIPARIAPVALAAGAGAWVASIISVERGRRGRGRIASTLVGALSAAAAALAGYQLRRWAQHVPRFTCARAAARR